MPKNMINVLRNKLQIKHHGLIVKPCFILLIFCMSLSWTASQVYSLGCLQFSQSVPKGIISLQILFTNHSQGKFDRKNPQSLYLPRSGDPVPIPIVASQFKGSNRLESFTWKNRSDSILLPSPTQFPVVPYSPGKLVWRNQPSGQLQQQLTSHPTMQAKQCTTTIDNTSTGTSLYGIQIFCNSFPRI